MATRRKVKAKVKAKSKVKAKRKKRTVGKAARGKTGALRNKRAKKPARRSTAQKARPKTAAKRKPISARAPAAAAKPSPARPAAPVSSEQRIGVVTHYYGHLSVAAMQLEPGASLRVGDVIHICGHTTDFTQRVESLEVDHAAVSEVGPKDDFGLKVIDHAREHDIFFKVRS